jgi:hypothetical protein
MWNKLAITMYTRLCLKMVCRYKNRALSKKLLAVHDCFKHAAGQDIFLLRWRQVLSYDVSLLNIRLIVTILPTKKSDFHRQSEFETIVNAVYIVIEKMKYLI